ncbi:5986_t:CDS:1, partial [Dentiscutata erythropus]
MFHLLVIKENNQDVIERFDNIEKLIKSQQKSETAISMSGIKSKDWNAIEKSNRPQA